MSSTKHLIHELFGNVKFSELYNSEKIKCEEVKEHFEFICSTCDREFVSARSLRSHENYHNSNLRIKIDETFSLNKETIIENSKIRNAKILFDKINEYEKLPNKCNNCFKDLTYQKRFNQFCTKSCSASFNNKKRDAFIYIKNSLKLKDNYNKLSNDEKIKIRNRMSLYNKKYLELKSYFCSYCNIEIRSTMSRKHCNSSECRRMQARESGKRSASKSRRRSKDEISLFELCDQEFVVLNNHIIANSWDADIVLPNEKIAILWNGPWHYKEMPGLKHSLKQVQNRDKIKKELFESLGWKVLIFEDREWTPQSAFEYLKELVDLPGSAPRPSPL